MLGAEKTIETRMQTLVHSMAAMYVNGAIPSSQNSNSSFQSHSGASSISVGSGSPSVFTQNFEYGFNAPDSSNMAAPQSSFPQYGTSNGNGFQSSGNNFGGQGTRLYGNNGYKGRNNGGYKPRYNNSKSGGFWSGNSSNRQTVIPECQICLRKGHTVVTCCYRSENNQVIQECQICGKKWVKWHIAIDCRHMGNYTYQGAPPPASLHANFAFQDHHSQF